MRTLTIDCGGSGLKGAVLDADGRMLTERLRVPTPYPLPPERFVATLTSIADRLGPFDRATVGMPGMLRHGLVVHTPHYPTAAGPFTAKEPALVAAWQGFDVRAALATAWDRPTLVLNDAEVQGAGAVRGAGNELCLTLGTGLGCALFDRGRLAPHLELSHHPFLDGLTYDRCIGKAARAEVGDAEWSRRVHLMVDTLRPVFWWDRLYLGGGGSKRVLGELPDDVLRIPNTAGITGGVRAWELVDPVDAL